MPAPLPSKLEMQIVDAPEGKVVKLRGELGNNEADTFKFQVTPFLRQKPKIVVFDMTELHFITSAGLGALATVRRSIVAGGGQARLAGIREKLKSVFKISGMNQLFGTFDTLEQALTT